MIAAPSMYCFLPHCYIFDQVPVLFEHKLKLWNNHPYYYTYNLHMLKFSHVCTIVYLLQWDLHLWNPLNLWCHWHRFVFSLLINPFMSFYKCFSTVFKFYCSQTPFWWTTLQQNSHYSDFLCVFRQLVSHSSAWTLNLKRTSRLNAPVHMPAPNQEFQTGRMRMSPLPSPYTAGHRW